MNIKNQYLFYKIILKAFVICFLLFSCSFNDKKQNISSQEKNKSRYEYIVKNDDFINEIEQSLSGNFIELSNGNTYYELANFKSLGPVIVLIHGFSVPSHIWEPTFQKAKQLRFKVLRFDLYGRGYSDNPNINYTDELFAKQSWELLDSLSINKAVLIGLSNGGRVISKMAQINPGRVEKLVYVSSNGFKDVKEMNNKSVGEAEILKFIDNYKFLSKSQMNDFKNPNQFKDWDKKYSELQKFKGFARALISTSKNHVPLDDIHKQIANNKIEVYTLWGKYDNVVVFEDFKNKLNQIIPNRKEFFFKSAGHLPQMESPKEFNTVLFEKILDFTEKK